MLLCSQIIASYPGSLEPIVMCGVQSKCVLNVICGNNWIDRISLTLHIQRHLYESLNWIVIGLNNGPLRDLLDLYSLSGWMSYRKISWTLEAARLDTIVIYRFKIWQTHRQRCGRGACQISERLEKSKPESRGFEASQDPTVRRPSV